MQRVNTIYQTKRRHIPTEVRRFIRVLETLQSDTTYT